MDARELRIGNWVRLDSETMENFHDDYLTDEFQIKGFGDGSGNDGCRVVCFYEIPSEFGVACSGEYDKFIEPIELTEDWLEKLGLKKIADYSFCFDGFLTLEVEDNDWENLCLDVYIENATTVHPIYITCLSYVHQIQNLYFSLTGKELEIKS